MMLKLYEGWEENEYWIDSVGFPSHEVSTYGRIRNKKTKHILKPFPDRYGYLRLSLGNIDNVPVHRVVCTSFYGPPPFSNAQVNHIDGDRQNNHIFNIEWVTPSQNIKWAVHHGNLDPYMPLQKAIELNKTPVLIVELNMEFPSVKECAAYLGVSPTNISRVLTGERKGQRIRGYHVEYAERRE